MHAKIFWETIPTEASFNPKVTHAFAWKEIDRWPTVDGKTSVVIQGERPGELVFKVLNEPFIQTQKQWSSAPYSVPSAEPVQKAA